MSHNKRRVEKQRFTFLGTLNLSRTVHLATDAKTNKQQYFIKTIYLGQQTQNFKNMNQSMFNKLYASPFPTIYKPESYSIDQQAHCLLLIQHTLPLSLQGIILYHKYKQESINQNIIYDFAINMYETFNRIRISGTQFFHRNFKPSNIFYQIKNDQIQWKLMQFGMLTNYPNKYYQSSKIISNFSREPTKSKTNISYLNDTYQGQLYSLAVILLQMMTLAPIDIIHHVLKQQRDINSIQGMDRAKKVYGQQLILFAKQLLHNKQSLKQVFQKLRENPPEFKEYPDYKIIEWTYQNFNDLIKDNPYNKMIQKLVNRVKQKQIPCQQAMAIAAKYDPELDFKYTNYKQLKLFMEEFKIHLSERQLVQISFQIRHSSGMNYMQILKNAYKPKQIIQQVLKKAINQYSTRKQFFQAMIGDKQYWKSDQITKFLSTLGVYFRQEDVINVLREWTGVNKRSSIKYEEFNKLFKGVGNQVSSIKTYSKSKKDGEYEKTLADLLNQLAQKLQSQQNKQNLINFFRTFDRQNKWIVGPEINKQIKNRVSIPDKAFKQISQQMWQIAGLSSETKKILRYVYLLKILKIYHISQLFKMVIIQKINQSNRQQFYRKYEKQEKGWSYDSLMDFNEQQQLQFDQRQIKLIFNQLDKDKSGFLNEKQLIFNLTGLRQFDKKFIIEKVMQSKKARRDLFQVFLSCDKQKDLFFDSPGQLAQVFQQLNVQIPSQHCQELFRNGMRKGKFPYLQFLRNFIQLHTLFIKSCKYNIEHYYNGKFQALYDLGKVKGKKHWNTQSLNKINDDLVLGFSYNQIGQIWSTINPQKEDVLTKQDIARVFGYSYEPDQNILGLDSTAKQNQKSNYSQKKESIKPEKQQRKDQQRAKSNLSKEQKQKKKNELVQKILQKKLGDVAKCFVERSRQNCQLTINDFCKCLDDLKIKVPRGIVLKNTSQFQILDQRSDNTRINFLNFLMYICQIQEEGKQARKVQCFIPILNQLIRFNGLNTEDIFKKCRKPDRMKLIQYQNFIRQIVKTQVYFQDIQDTWKYWDEPDYLTPQNFNSLLSSRQNSQKPPIKLTKQISFARQQQKNQKSQQNQTNSPYFPKRMRPRRESQDKGRDKEDIRDSNKNTQYNPRRKDSRDQKQRQQGRYDRQNDKQYQRSEISNDRKERNTKYDKNQRQDKERAKKEEEKPQFKPTKSKFEKQVTKASALQRFENKIKQIGSQKLNNLFQKSNSVPAQQFGNYIQLHYDLDHTQCEKIIQAMSSFGSIKIQTVKKYIKKIQLPKKQDKNIQQNLQRQQNKKSLSPNKQSLGNRDSLANKGTTKQNIRQKQKLQYNENLRLQNPRKLKLNIPLVKQHIKILISSFTKRFDINEMQPFFFESNTTIDKQAFIKKCCQINSSISKNMYQKIFLYLKPKNNQITSISFKLSFSFDQQIKLEEVYLPQQIENQIKNIFEKCDKDKSGFIQFNQIQSVLGTLGLNQSQKQIQAYFEKIDKNFDKKISIKQFKMFIQDNILPYISDFDQDVDALSNLLKLNDIFRTGYISVSVLGPILERYGVKISQKQINTLNRYIANDNNEVSIKQFINILYFPSQPSFPSSLKAILYKIRWRRKINFRQIQKIFENISACFVVSYTSQLIKKKLLTQSTFITPVLNQSRLFYNDYFYSNFSKLDQKGPVLVSIPKPSDLIVQIKLIQASGLPIPQNQQIKSTILNRYANIIFYDTSLQQGKHCLSSLQIQFDPDIEDQWIFNRNNRSIFVKIGNYEARKYQKMLILFQFIITIVDGNRTMDISCGTASFQVRQLVVDSKVNRRYKIIAGLPNKSKDIDKNSISKRKGWRGLISASQLETQLSLQLVPSNKSQDKLQFIAALPQKSIVNRKSLHLFWTFRQYFAVKSVDNKRINPDFANSFLVKTFLLCLDIPDIYEELILFWKQRIQPKAVQVYQARRIFHFLMLDLFIVINSKQFQILPSFPSKNSYSNKSLRSLRKKLLEQVFYNIQQWVNSDARREYKRAKPYGVDIQPFKIQQRQITSQIRNISEQLTRVK